MNNTIVWTIAGSDCTGGAGIQADIKTLHNLGVKACTVITAVTAQNSSGVLEINSVSAEVLSSQLNALSAELPASVIKIGLLTNVQQVEQIAERLTFYKGNWPQAPIVVYDPVAIASCGDHLTEEDILVAIKTKLLPLVDVLTPNNNELQKLSGVYAFSWQCLARAGQVLLDLGVGSVAIKGGHIDIAAGYCVDYCTDGEHNYWLASKRINHSNNHGTGCTYASAVSACLAQGFLLRDAVSIAKAYINQGLSHQSLIKKARQKIENGAVWQGGWPVQAKYFPKVLVAHSTMANALDWQLGDNICSTYTFAKNFPSTACQSLGLYPVVDSVEWVKRLLAAGVKTLQYREKQLTGEPLSQAIEQVVLLGKQYNARVFINDYWQLAIKFDAYGIHLGQEDLLKADLAKIKSVGLRLGISTHGYYEFLQAQEYQPSYIAVGAIFPTKTKDMSNQIQGTATLARLVKLNTETPIVAIGGITLNNATEVLNTGVGSIAVVTAITESKSPESVIESFEQIFECC
ncbi:thiamine phosphate synthase [Thalassotalea piscium]|uniref:Thiamine-phosphate synthase n=1 Tax=Thalassotalea piscium TaxID=1230533 RepID=A0A7X0NEQ7_9GAMM|nr:thiamine phosphate synthase [Thalassotalea piscium]MBB6542094.1 hydroxymethylpyrimidine kinase/phosphomethylpyrimidine kinase/thiamine-phosphate diphosphorylase [Thalassotalea piscium]